MNRFRTLKKLTVINTDNIKIALTVNIMKILFDGSILKTKFKKLGIRQTTIKNANIILLMMFFIQVSVCGLCDSHKFGKLFQLYNLH